MGDRRAPRWLQVLGWACAALIVVINLSLLLQLAGWI
jgi:Mn2+/Fe2+ NRAMP family transporter